MPASLPLKAWHISSVKYTSEERGGKFMDGDLTHIDTSVLHIHVYTVYTCIYVRTCTYVYQCVQLAIEHAKHA